MSADPAIQVTRLPSGLTVVTETMPRVETVSLGAYVGAGTRHERAEENGVSHFLEHMAFKGTARRSAAQIAEEIEDVGGHLNAYTARELEERLVGDRAGRGEHDARRRIVAPHEADQRLALHRPDRRLGAERRQAHRLVGIGGLLEVVEH